jgi:hypothetical protein
MNPSQFKTFKISGNRFYFTTYDNLKLEIILKSLSGDLLYHQSDTFNPNVTYFIQHNNIINNEFIININGIDNIINRFFNKIMQVSSTPFLSHFLPGLKKRWGLYDYYDMDAPCLFFGCWEQQLKINDHSGYKILVFSSHTDANWFNGCNEKYFQHKITNYDKLIVSKSATFKSINGVKTKFLSNQGIGFEIKDYSIYQPKVLGDKIYVYLAAPDRKDEFFFNTIERISKKIPFEIIYGIKDGGPNEFDSEEHMLTVYDQCFLNINFNLGKGLTTVAEMAYKGIKTLANKDRTLTNHWACMIDCDINNDDQIISLIMEESHKIGSKQPPINIHEVGNEWQDLKFWINE